MSEETTSPLDTEPLHGPVSFSSHLSQQRAPGIVSRIYGAAFKLWSKDGDIDTSPGFMVASDGVNALIALAPTEAGSRTVTVYQIDLELNLGGVDEDGLIDVFVPHQVQFPEELALDEALRRERFEWVMLGADAALTAWLDPCERDIRHATCCATGGVW